MAVTVRLGEPTDRKPAWLRVSLPIGDDYERVKAKVEGLGLHTVCKEAACPNVAECWGAGTATIMILGDTCTRGCRFCNVKTGNPRGEVDWLEPLRVAEAVRDLGGSISCVTAVDRDDLADGGALIFANTVRAIHERVPGARVEILSGDYRGDLRARRHRARREARRVRAQPRDGAAAHALGARQACELRSVARGAAARQGPRPGPVHQDVADAWPRRDARTRSRPQWTTRARPASTSSRWASTCSQAKSISGRRVPYSRRVRPARRVGRTSKGFHQVVSSPLSRSSYHAEQAF